MAIFENLPYTNYHDLNANWIIQKVKEVAEAWTEYRDSMDEAWTEYRDSMDEWKDGVDAELQTFYNWFDNLDLTDEVRTIIEEMVQDGSFMTAATPVITTTTESWLMAHVSQGYAVDNTLTISGAAADSKVTGDRITQLKEDLTAIAIRPTVSGSIASFNDGAENVPMKSLVVNIEPLQSGSGEPSPTNVRPITGWTEVNTTRCGVNLWDEEWEAGAIANSTGNNTSQSDTIRSKNYIPIAPNVTYYVKAPSGTYLRFYDKNQIYLGSDKSINGYANFTFTSPENAMFMRFYLSQTTYNNDISINYPSTDTAYHSHTDNDTYTTTLGQTVYGGKLDVVSGELVIDRILVDLGSLDWTYQSAYNRAYSDVIENILPPVSDNDAADAICSAYPVRSTNGEGDKKSSVSTSRRIWVFDTSYSSAAEYKQGLDGVQFCYKLATNIEIQLSPQDVTSLLGANNVFADAGSVDVTYCADGKMYIDNRIAELQALILEQ